MLQFRLSLRFAIVTLCLLGLTGHSASASQELDPLWQAAIQPEVEDPGASKEVRGRAALVATAALQNGGKRLVLRMFDADGSELWQRSSDQGVLDEFADLELSPDGATLFVLYKRPATGKSLSLVTFDALTGAEGWSRTLVGDSSLLFVRGKIAVEGARVAVLISDHDNNQVYLSRITTLSLADGAELSTSANFPFINPSLYLAPSWLTGFVFDVSGKMASVALSTGSTWSAPIACL